jgi:hypothetical protein
MKLIHKIDYKQGGHSKVRYFIDRSSDRRRQFAISEDGTVSIQRELDRETSPSHQVPMLLFLPRIFSPKKSAKKNRRFYTKFCPVVDKLDRKH